MISALHILLLRSPCLTTTGFLYLRLTQPLTLSLCFNGFPRSSKTFLPSHQAGIAVTFLKKVDGEIHQSILKGALDLLVDCAEPVGMTCLLKAGDGNEKLATRFICVHPAYRCRGLAIALTWQVIELAQHLGARFIQTSNAENNPMFQLNLNLGFQVQSAVVDWEKMLREVG